MRYSENAMQILAEPFCRVNAEDDKAQLAIVTDRSQGVASLVDGQMVTAHRLVLLEMLH
jgi:hypothetical protein